MIIISKEEEKVEILSQPTVEEQLEQAFEPRPVEEELEQPISKDNGEEFFLRIL